MNIGIDIDGVILDTENWFRSMSHIYDKHINGGGVVNPTAVKTQKRMAWNQEQTKGFIEDCMFYGMKKAPLMPCCKYVIEKLKEMGHRLVVITARGSNYSEEEIKIAKDVFDEYDLKFDKVYFNVQNKLPVCLEENIDYMIDDSFDNVTYLSEAGVKCLYFRDYGSIDVNNDKVIDVSNWGEIYKFISELK